MPSSAPANLAHAVEEATALDAPADALSAAAEALTANEAVAGVLTGAATGLPLHPALVHFPIGFAYAALAVDLLGGRESGRAVMILSRLTWLAALPAAASGLASYAGLEAEAPRRVGALHAVANSSGTALAFTSCLSRTLGHRGLARVLLAGSAAAYGFGGFLGGHLTYGGRAD